MNGLKEDFAKTCGNRFQRIASRRNFRAEAAIGGRRLALELEYVGHLIDLTRLDHLPVEREGVTHRGPYKNGPGEINIPINMGGMAVNPGDIIVGDADGLVAVPQDQAERILKSAQAILAKETAAMKEIEAGTVDRSWVDKALKEKGYKI